MILKAETERGSESEMKLEMETEMAHGIMRESERANGKEFAHSTMNELLGWYGFDGVDVDRLDLTAKTSRLLQSAAAVASQQHHLHHQDQEQQHQMLERRRTGFLRSSRSSLAAAYHSNNNNHTKNNTSSNGNGNGNASASAGAGAGGSGCGRKGGIQYCNRTTTTPSDHDTRSSREDDSKSPNSIGKPVTTVGMLTTEEKIDFNNCCWCHRPIAENAPDYLTSSDGPRYCSESCFTQSRRACFKKAKTCDWCKHVRHAVSYVDFQDGASQLQFCSEKCLNQYKMQIFCNETQAHLDMNPHLRDQGLEAGSEAGLITPDLWLRNCRSRSASPASTVSVSPGPPAERSAGATAKRISPSVTPPSNPSKPLISVAPVSKLLAQKSPAPAAAVPPPPPPPQQRHHNSLGSGPGLKPGRRKRPQRGPSSSSGSETVASMLQKQHHQQQQQQQHQPTLSADFSGSSVPLPPLSPMPEPAHPHQQQQQPPTVVPPQVLGRGPTAIPSSYFAPPPNGHPMGLPFGRHPAQPPHHFLPPPHGMMPRGFPPPFGLPMPTQVPEHLGAFAAMMGAVPPVTVMVPYPIIIPLPIPIPVPLPVMDFYKAHLTPEQRKQFDEERATTSRREDQPQPLDCSKARSDKDQDQEQDGQPEEEPKPPPELKEEQVEEDEKEKDEDVDIDDDCNDNDDDEDKKSIPKTTSAGNASPASASASPSPSSSSPATDATALETHCIVRDETHSEADQDNQKLPKLKITRLQAKRTLIQTKEPTASTSSPAPPSFPATPSGSNVSSECSRPLRKRKRIIDCDFQKMALRELEPGDGGHNQESSPTKDGDGECNITNSNNHGNAKAKK
ncbi:sine oculis-binding protein homolog A isoform X2 [Drosophila miranda]|uniref:sine oculis-binding protein homolog A isoform X2 n=1 Tax=Drosophila miranda TaxID=7229 RepID=UPI0007E5C1CD|nr:sine oculis-binding protein homolog A isoform X2 [Drosophila miranda]